MTTKELIAKLQEADPEGNDQVSVGNTPIYFIERGPVWYDGRQVELHQDHSKDPYFNIVGMGFAKGPSKVVINTYSFRDALLDNPEFPFDYSNHHEGPGLERTKQWHEKLREDYRKLDESIKEEIQELKEPK